MEEMGKMEFQEWLGKRSALSKGSRGKALACLDIKCLLRFESMDHWLSLPRPVSMKFTTLVL